VSDKAKWAGIYLLVCFIPLFFYFLPPLSPEIVSHRAITDFLIFAPYVGLTVIAILGWQINQTRIFWSTLLLLAFYYYLLHPDTFTVTATGWGQTLQIVSVAYPLALCVIYLLKESRLWSDLSLARFLLALFPFLLFICLFSWAPDVYQKLFFWGPANPAQLISLPKLSWVATGLFLLVVTYLPDIKIKSFLIALMTTFVPFLFCIQANLINGNTTTPTSLVSHIIIAFATITVILLFALFRMYVQKVYLDPLTAVSNRQAMDERLHTLSGQYALAMVDIDHFKKFNDTYGHAEGDNVLRMVAQHLQEHLGDRVYRYGGEEFCVIFEGPTQESAVEMMEKVRATMEKRKFTLRGKRSSQYEGMNLPFKKDKRKGKKVSITFSAGVAFVGKTRKTPEEVIKRADHFLYEAKEKGRNRTVSEAN
jgi:diguanylate cyclase (GGDEF)-like protein